MATGAMASAMATGAMASAIREPDSLPDAGRPAGTSDERLPFDHVVVVMMENHSFDNVLGALAEVVAPTWAPQTGPQGGSRLGQPAADGLTFDASGAATNSNPGVAGMPPEVRAFPLQSTAQGTHVSQSWNATHEQIDGGRMDGFVSSVASTQPMGYYTPEVLPFEYSLASTFTIANRWFCSAPCQTIPNRRFLYAGTAYGAIATDLPTLFDGSPPNGTIFDRLDAHGISWHNYFTDLPATIVIPSIVERHFTHLRPVERFYADCASGALPAVSFVDAEAGVFSFAGQLLAQLPVLSQVGARLETHGTSEEAPQDMRHGERWAHRVIDAVLRSPLWPRTLLVYTYDEHGGYYDHVPPPPAIPPDSIPPKLAATDAPGGYDIYGPRVPAVVVSPHSRPNAVTDVVHDHTSVLATIEAKWNLPALTRRDANAATILDFLDLEHAAFMSPPTIAAPR